MKKHYFNIISPNGLKRIILAETHFEAIQEACVRDDYKWGNSEYKWSKA